MNRTTVVVAAVMVAIAIALLAFLMRPSDPGAITGSDRAEDAREFLAELRQEGGAKSYNDAYERARNHREKGQLADAQILYFYAARGGHAGAEFELAAMNDPNYHTGSTSLLSEPDPYQAYKWYRAALEHGSADAQARLDALHDWATRAAADGNSEAERVLLQWSQ